MPRTSGGESSPEGQAFFKTFIATRWGGPSVSKHIDTPATAGNPRSRQNWKCGSEGAERFSPIKTLSVMNTHSRHGLPRRCLGFCSDRIVYRKQVHDWHLCWWLRRVAAAIATSETLSITVGLDIAFEKTRQYQSADRQLHQTHRVGNSLRGVVESGKAVAATELPDISQIARSTRSFSAFRHRWNEHFEPDLS